MRRRFSHLPALKSGVATAVAEAHTADTPLEYAKLFGLTYAAGFLFVSLLIV
uniref:hypothetical protein n=1 Tax=uncultured Sphingomonas sp. TaxID=158754 RepID=UPI0025EFDCD2|nr:hypothetical protein [uncultured Sphingomonas sp.]